MSVLDAGCGTGNYALGLLDAGLGHITMMDGSDGMLKTAHMKTANYQSIAEYRLARLPQLPFPDESFDVVMFNQVGRSTHRHFRNLSKMFSSEETTLNDYTV